MKAVIEIKGRLTKGDLVFFDGENLVPVRKNVFLDEVNMRVDDLSNELQSLENKIDELKNSINSKLKEYHDLLQVLTKEGE